MNKAFSIPTILLVLLAAGPVRTKAQNIAVGGSEGDSSLWFFDGGVFEGQRLLWDDSQSCFELSDDLKVNGVVTASSELRSNGDIFVNHDGPDIDSHIYFFKGANPVAESIKWDVADGRFELSDTVNVRENLVVANPLDLNHNIFGLGITDSGQVTNAQDLMVSDDLEVGGTVYFNKFLYMQSSSASGQDGDQTLFFYEDNNREGEHFRWDNGNDRFEISAPLQVDGDLNATDAIQVGISALPGAVAYNAFGGTGPVSGDMGNNGDLFIDNDLEIGGDAYFDRNIFALGNSNTGADADQNIYFYDLDDRDANYIRWDNLRSDSACGTTNAIDSGFVWNIQDDSNSAWVFTTGSDIEFRVDDDGSMAIDGSLTQSSGCDVAETFFGLDLEPGTVVVMDPENREAVIEASEAYQATVVGVVSTDPGFLLNGPTADFYPYSAELRNIRAKIQADPENDALVRRSNELESMKDGWARGNLPVALLGRVPVKVDGTYGTIQAGDPLTTSPTPGHAMTMARPGPAIGLALEDFEGERGEVLVLIKPGWHGLRSSGSATNLDSGPPRTRAKTKATDGHLEDLIRTLVAEALAQRDEPGSTTGSTLDEVDSLRASRNNVAEYRPVSQQVEAGDILVVDRDQPGFLTACHSASDAAVVGIATGQPGVATGVRISSVAEAMPSLTLALDAAQTAQSLDEAQEIWREMAAAFEAVHTPVVTSGIALAKVDASYNSIEIGDLLTSSPTRGHAMRSDDVESGTIVGKALEPLAEGTGLIQILVMLR